MRRRAAARGPGGKERILDAAVHSFAERGYDGTTTAGVARTARVAQPLVHKHFGSKLGLWRAAMERVFSGVKFFEDAPADGQPLQSTVSALLRFVELNAAFALPHQIVLREGSRDSERLAHLLDRYLRPQFRAAVRNVRAAQRGGLLDSALKPELLVLLALGAGSYLPSVGALARRALGVNVGSERTRRAFADMVLKVMREGAMARGDRSSEPTPPGRRR